MCLVIAVVVVETESQTYNGKAQPITGGRAREREGVVWESFLSPDLILSGSFVVPAALVV